MPHMEATEFLDDVQAVVDWFIEDNGLAPVEMIRQNRQARFKILDALASIREEHGVRAWPSFQEVIEQIGIDREVFDANEGVLTNLGSTEWPAMQLMTITSSGMNQAIIWRSQVKHFQLYRYLQEQKDLSPQVRGHELEMLLREILCPKAGKLRRTFAPPVRSTT